MNEKKVWEGSLETFCGFIAMAKLNEEERERRTFYELPGDYNFPKKLLHGAVRITIEEIE